MNLSNRGRGETIWGKEPAQRTNRYRDGQNKSIRIWPIAVGHQEFVGILAGRTRLVEGVIGPGRAKIEDPQTFRVGQSIKTVVEAAAMEILLVGSELGPWLSNSDASEELAALAKSLKQLGNDVTVLVPYHADYERGGLLVARRLSPLELPNGHAITVFDAQLSSGAKMVLLGMPAGVDTTFVLDSAVTASSLKASCYFARGVAAYVEQRAEQGKAVDVIHCFDWPTALAALAIRGQGQKAPSPIVFSLHDASHVALASKECISEVDDSLLQTESLRVDNGDICLLNAGLVSADVIVTPSERVLRQLRTGESLRELSAVTSAIQAPFAAVAPGVDYARVNPATNPGLVSRFDAEDSRNKAANKTDWLRHAGLSLEPRPLFLVPGPVTKDDGGAELLAAIPVLLEMELALCVLSSTLDDAELIRSLRSQIAGRAEDAAIVELTNEEQAHRAFAAADFTLYPNRDGRSLLSHLAAERYGALTIGCANTTLAETVVDADAGLATGTGFLFDACTSANIIAAVGRAVSAYKLADFERLRRRVMRKDVSSDRPARRLLQIYRKAMTGAGSMVPPAN